MADADSTSNPSVVRSNGADQSTAKVYLVGGGIASLAAAVFMIRDGDILRPQHHYPRGTRQAWRSLARFKMLLAISTTPFDGK